MGRGIERAKKPRETIARLASYLLVYKIQLALVVVSIVVAGVLQLLGPYLIGVTIDQYILKGDVPGLVQNDPTSTRRLSRWMGDAGSPGLDHGDHKPTCPPADT